MTALALVIMFSFCALYRVAKRLKRRLPPGPKGLPILGNFFGMPTGAVWKNYHRMAREYHSPLISLDILGSSVIVIDTLQAAEDLIVHRSSIYASRPRMPMMNEHIGFEWHLAFLPAGKEWRDRRKLFHRLYDTPGQSFIRPYSTRAARRLLLNLLENPTDFRGQIRLLSGSLILAATYGLDVKSMNDPHIVRAEVALYAMGEGFHGFLVDHFPLLSYLPSWFPGGRFKLQAKEWRKSVQAMTEIPFAQVRSWMSQGAAPDSLGFRQLSESEESDSYGRKVLQDVLGAAYAGGADTTVSALSTFILAMVLNPEVQKRGQNAVDATFDQQQLPDFAEYGSIPYVDAIIKEVLRWMPVLPLGAPYATLKDDSYAGYDIPAGSTVYVNAWAMLHDEDTYGPDPTDFKPERFLDKNGALNPDMRDPEEAFGFGRRICPGQVLARDSLWISIVSLLATMDINKAIGHDGVPITPLADCTPHLMSHPVSFDCSIKARSPAAASLIRTSQIAIPCP